MSHTEDSEMYSPGRIDPDRAQKKSRWYLSQEGRAMFVRAVEITQTVGNISHTIRYELEGGKPVELWEYKGEPYIVTVEDALAGKWPWEGEL